MAEATTQHPSIGYGSLPSHVADVGYDRAQVKKGAVLLGAGNFALAHSIHFVHQYMAATGDLSWGFTAASLRSPGTVMGLRKHDHQYVLIERERDERKASVVGAIVDSIFAPEDPFALVAAIASPDTKLVTATITNKGYYLDSEGDLDASHHDIVHDLDLTPEMVREGLTLELDAEAKKKRTPRTVYWYLTQALIQRRENGQPLTVMSLDNVANNSKSMKRALLQYLADNGNSDLVGWVEENVDFLTTLVDRITPEVTSTFRKEAAELIGFEAPVVIGTEMFSQLVVEKGRFAMPDWSAVGVEVVEDCGSYWELKFLGLNAAHTLAAFLAYRSGMTYIHEVMQDALMAKLVAMFHSELGAVLGEERMASYGPKIQRRFADHAPMDTARRVGARGTSKASERLLYSVERILEATDGKQVSKAGTFGLALWLLNLGNTDENGQTFAQDDVELPKLGEVHAEVLAWTQSENSSDHDLTVILRKAGEATRENRFVKMAGNHAFVAELARSLRSVSKVGVTASINELLGE